MGLPLAARGGSSGSRAGGARRGESAWSRRRGRALEKRQEMPRAWACALRAEISISKVMTAPLPLGCIADVVTFVV